MLVRHRRQGSWFTTLIAVVLLLVIGTVLGRDLHLGPLSQTIGFNPVALDMYIVNLTIGLATNVLGLVGALLGLILFRVV